jgi:DUF2075 family protein
MLDDVSEMRAEIVRRDREVGLSRLVAGYAWEWKTKGNKPGHHIEIGELRLRWNSTQTDWIPSPGSLDEVGSIRKQFRQHGLMSVESRAVFRN